ncbi:cobalamin biosynthesis protein CbiX, partial [Streptomyces sp. NPDC001478]
DPDPAEGVRRCRLLGARRVTLLPAAFALPEVPGADGPVPVDLAGPLLSPQALRRVLAERVSDARRRWRDHGDDGIAAGLTAADDHGHSHTHPPGEGHDHGHGHAHGHPHPHPPDDAHGHGPHGPGHLHPHHHHPSAAGADRAIGSIA